jgi:formylglycine-generating enzyme required for sulfatase activity/energy-coupling factor transporter ATP-binding protein EcfA2
MSRQREAAQSLGIQGPYPGLRPYQRHESLIFFGRERQIDQMKEKLRNVRLLGVVGSSGCGKSSLVKAGLFPALDSGFLVTRDLPWSSRWPAWSASRWFVVDMQPRNHPFRGLAQGLLQSGLLGERWDAADAANVPALAARLQSGPGQLLRLWEQAQSEPAGNLLIVVDQFEELFRFQDMQHAGMAQSFVGSLLDLAAQPDWPVYVAITMRSDFLGDCALFPGLPEVLNAGQFLVSRLTPRDIQAAVEGPAQIFDVDLDPRLVTRILNDVGADSDQLPLLQHALKRTWDLTQHADATDGSSRPARLTLADYDRPEIGGVAEALDRHAEAVLTSLSGADDSQGDKRVARLLFQSLTTRDASQRDVRRPTPAGIVAEVAEVPLDRVLGVVQAFRHPDCCFLTPPVPVTLAAGTWLDISHESLLRQWQRLRGWVQAEADSADELQRLARDARSWQQGNRGLLRQPELGVLLRWREQQRPTDAWAARHVQPGDFALAIRYLEDSRSDEERQGKEKEEARRQELDRERQRTAAAEAASRRQRKLAGIAMAVAAVAIISLAFAAWQSVQLVLSSQRQTAVLVKATVTAPDEHFPELVEFLQAYQAGAIVPLRRIIQNSNTPPSQKANAALALAAWGEFDAMRPALSLAENPLARTKFIHEYSRVRGDLTEAAIALAAAVTDPTAADFRSGLCAALGLIPWDTMKGEEPDALRKTLLKLYTDAPDGGTHSAAWFALKSWKQENSLPELPRSSWRPADDRGWFVNSRGMTMIRIPADTFWMGDDTNPDFAETHRHKVTLTNDFFLGDGEVTVGQFKEFVRQVTDDPKWPQAEKDIAKSWDEGEEMNVSPQEDCPVQQVNWFQAVAFCNWLSRCEPALTPCYALTEVAPDDDGNKWKCDLIPQGNGYRLPTEAEWEYACRAESQTQYAFGDDERLLAQYAWYERKGGDRTWPAGTKLPNGWGLFDMHGNVWEWCQDWYAADYYKKSSSSDPPGPPEGRRRVCRGGSWFGVGWFCRSAFRDADDPGFRGDNLGFRVCLARGPAGAEP